MTKFPEIQSQRIPDTGRGGYIRGGKGASFSDLYAAMAAQEKYANQRREMARQEYLRAAAANPRLARAGVQGPVRSGISRMAGQNIRIPQPQQDRMLAQAAAYQLEQAQQKSMLEAMLRELDRREASEAQRIVGAAAPLIGFAFGGPSGAAVGKMFGDILGPQPGEW